MNNKLLKKFSIQPLRFQDVMAILKIDHKNHSQWPLRYYIKSLTSPHFYSYIARMNDITVGSMLFRISIHDMHIDRIIVDLSFRRKGIGGRLLKNGLFIAQKKNAINSFLIVSAQNKIAINFYTKYGFQIDAIEPGYYSGKDDGLRMKRLI